MTFRQIPLPKPASANDTVCPEPEDASSWDILRAIRDARSVLGLRSGHIQTLQAMFSFLKPGQGQVVFASNVELCRRAGNIDERTLRRHIARLRELGLLDRQDSSNRKRYRVSAPDGASLSFGLSLSPLFKQAARLIALAQEIEDERRHCRLLRKRILVSLAVFEEHHGETERTRNIRKALRRKLDIAGYHALLADLPALSPPCPTEPITSENVPETPVMTASNGQNDRHHSKSEKERQDSDRLEKCSVEEIVHVCRDAIAFSNAPLQSWSDLERYALDIATMMGIDLPTYRQASEHHGSRETSLTVLLILQLGRKIRNMPAYFRSLTLGQRANGFNPVKLLHRIGSVHPCPGV